MKLITREAAGLRYRRVTQSDRPDLLVLLCHGYGAPGTDLVPLGEELIRASDEIAARVAFVFPEAPISLGGFPGFEQRAWWPIDMAALEASLARGVAVDRRLDCPNALVELRPRLLELIAAERRDRLGSRNPDGSSGGSGHTAGGEEPLPMSGVVLGGFSQGAMLATDLALGAEEAPAALVAFSGTLLCEAEWRRIAPGRRGMRVLQSHGRQDPLLAFEAAEALRDLLVESGANLDFLPFDGQHEIPLNVLMAFRDMLLDLLAATSIR